MTTNQNRQSYNAIAQQWHQYRKNSFLSNLVIDFTNRLPTHATVLDIGCGTGYPILHHFAQQGFQSTGIDCSENMLFYARQLDLPNTTLLHCDFFDFQPTHLFDGIIAFDSFFHFPLKKQRSIYTIMSQWLRPDGYLLFSHGKEEGVIEGTMFDASFYYSSLNGDATKDLLQKAGFSILRWDENFVEQQTEKDLVVLAQKE